MNKIRFAQLYEWFTLLIFGLFLIFDLTWRGNTMFNTIAYVFFAAIGLIGLLTLKSGNQTGAYLTLCSMRCCCCTVQ